MRSRFLLTCAVAALIACKDSGAPGAGGGSNQPAQGPAQLVLAAGGDQVKPANTDVSGITISVRDASGKPVTTAQTVTFDVTAGGGSVASATAQSDANGNVTVPTWRMGKGAVPQRLRATLGSLPPLEIKADVKSDYKIDIRFFGGELTQPQKDLFLNAAHRIEGIIIGDLPDAEAFDIEVAKACGVVGQPNLNEVIDDVIIFASIRNIDGPGNILAQAGPCYFRDSSPRHTAIGVMSFDVADITLISGNGSFQEVVTHEMLHVVGFGSLWNNRGLLTGVGTGDTRFTGAQARAGCEAVGGTVTCASNVPVETLGGGGTANVHWRESTFTTELMTGFINAGANSFSAITVGSLGDLGFTINGLDYDVYTIPGGSIRADAPTQPRTQWELPLETKDILLLGKGGKVRRIARVK